MAIVIIIYILLLVAFLIVSSLIFRHSVRFGYLSPRFKTVVWIFSALALTIIAISIYLLALLGRTPSFGGDAGSNNVRNERSSGDLNF